MLDTLLAKAGLYPRARNAYQRFFNREWMAERRALREQFRPYVQPGDLVFDIGANRGHYSESFYELGARVVAVEPNPDLAEMIRLRYGRRLVDVLCAAVGAERGEAQLHLARDDQHSTVSERWQQACGEPRWYGTITVPVVTLDELIGRYGVPAFVKIDTEGSDAEVLRGLTVPIDALCFEWVRALPEMTEACEARLRELGDYDLSEPDSAAESDDIFARRRARSA